MKRAMFTLTLLMAGMLLYTGCTSVHQTMREPNARVEFEKDDFEFSEQVSATATSTTIFSIDWERLFRQETGDVEGVSIIPINLALIPVVGHVMGVPAANFALYEMMQTNPGYDVVFYPQYLITVEKPVLGLGFIYKTTTVTATARLARIK